MQIKGSSDEVPGMFVTTVECRLDLRSSDVDRAYTPNNSTVMNMMAGGGFPRYSTVSRYVIPLQRVGRQASAIRHRV